MADDDPLVLEDNAIAQLLFGENDRFLRAIEAEIGVEIQARGNRVRVKGGKLERKVVHRVLRDLYDMVASGLPIDESDVHQVTRLAQDGSGSPAAQAIVDGEAVEVGRRKRIVPRTENQRQYVSAIRSHDMIFGVGPAGTGKTYLAMAMAVSALRRRECALIILTRPAVEAGQKLGFLPGTVLDKIDPYLRPLSDALHDMLEPDEIARRMERGIIEVAPLAYMRGRTLNDAFIVLDETQNTTSEQMRMFLTRMGFDSKAVINGDVSQTDLPKGVASGLIEARRFLADIPGISFVNFNEKDVVRHPLVQEIIKAYERVDSSD